MLFVTAVSLSGGTALLLPSAECCLWQLSVWVEVLHGYCCQLNAVCDSSYFQWRYCMVTAVGWMFFVTAVSLSGGTVCLLLSAECFLWQLLVPVMVLHDKLYRSIYIVLTVTYLSKLHGFLCAFVKFRKVTVSFVNSACLSVCMKQLCLH